MIKCGECGYYITVETHTKHYKNGNSQTFGYYRCTKKNKKNRCNQPYLATDKLEDQYKEDLGHFELMPEFAEWALEALDEVKKKDDNVNKNSHEALQKTLENINKRINNLVSLKISPDNSDGSLLSDEEFGDRKRNLLIEKEKVMKKLSQTDPENTEWAELAKESFNFGLLAASRFEDGGSDDKKVIFRTIGSNPTLKDKKLRFKAKYPFFYYKEGIKKTKEKIGTLEPINVVLDQSNLENYLKSSVWCRGEDLNLHPASGTRPSSVRVYQFRHLGNIIQSFFPYPRFIILLSLSGLNPRS